MKGPLLPNRVIAFATVEDTGLACLTGGLWELREHTL